MPPLIEPLRTDFIEDVLKEKFGNAYGWEKPILGETVGPSAPSVYDEYEQKRDQIVSLAREWITQVVDEQPNKFRAIGNDLEQARILFGDHLDEEIRSVLKVPARGHGGFGHPAVAPDFSYWGKMKYYELEEALLLSVGADPKLFSKEFLRDLSKPRGITDRTWPHLVFLMDRKELFERQFGAAYIRNQIEPKDLKFWIDDIKLEVHSGFYAELESRTNTNSLAPPIRQQENLPPQTETKVDRRTIDALAQLITAMAVDSYGYVPNSRRSPIPKEMSGVMASLGMSMTDETVRKYLRLGEKFISDDWEPPQS